MFVSVLRALRALVNPVRKGGALHPRPIPGRMQETWLLPPGSQVDRRGLAYEGPGGSRTTRRWVQLIPLGLLAAVSVLGHSLHAQNPAHVQPRLPHFIDVTPDDGGPVSTGPGGSGSVIFTVTTTQPGGGTYALSCSVTGAVSSCSIDSPDDPHLGLDQYESANVTVSYVVGSSGTGTVVLTASNVVSDDGSYDITVSGAVAPTLSQPRQSDSVFNRSRCLTTSAGVFDWSCGDALLMLETSSFTTLDRARSMTLAYASNTASPTALVSADVTLPSGEPTLARVRAVLTVNGSVQSNVTYTAWANATHQVVLGWNAASASTGSYPYTLTVYAVTGSDSASSSVSGVVNVVNRSTSPYGAGFEWLGVERLVFNQPVSSGNHEILWVDGDGSSKLYHQLNGSTWVAPSEAFRDTITLASNEYTRTMQHGIQVVFDTLGRHVRTVNRAGQVTTFYWHSLTQLDSVHVPPSGAAGRTFGMRYASNVLDSVLVGGRDIGVTVSGTAMTRWRWPDGTYDSLHTASNGKIDSLVDARRGGTRVHYAANGLIDTSYVWYDSTGSRVSATMSFGPWQSVGYAGSGSSDTSVVVTAFDGPPVGAGYRTVMHVDRWGGAASRVDALGHVTSYRHDNATVPALVTEIDYPNTRKLLMSYNSRGNLDSVRDSTASAGHFPLQTTRWSYADATNKDSPTQLTAADGTTQMFHWNGSDELDSMVDARGHNTVYTYGSGVDSIRGQLLSVTDKSVRTWIQSLATDRDTNQVTQLLYDASGNTVQVTNPAGGVTRYARDAAGRVSTVTDPARFIVQHAYDAMDRDTLTTSSTSLATAVSGCIATEFTCSDSMINNLSANALHTRKVFQHGDLVRVDDARSVTHRYGYDQRGMMVADTDETGTHADTYTYDRRGLLTVRHTRKNYNLTFAYDSLGRETRWTMPADTITMFGEFYREPQDTVTSTYDAIGNLLVHRNRHGSITRTYFDNGIERTEAIHGVAAGDSSNTPLVTDSVMLNYDVHGRLSLMNWHSRDTLGRGGDSVRYAYKSSGDLDSVVVSLINDTGRFRRGFAFAWDGLGRRQQLTYPTYGMTVVSHYDRLGVIRKVESAMPGTGAGYPNRFHFVMSQDSVDPLGRPLHQQVGNCDSFSSSDAGDPCGDWMPQNAVTRYNRTGSIAVQALDDRNSYTTTDSITYDGSGNRSVLSRHDVTGATVTRYNYPAASNRLSTDSIVTAGGWMRGHYFYANDGARLRAYKDDTFHGASPFDDHFYQYDGAGRLAGTGTNGFTAPYSCGYDPDGRLFKSCGTAGQVLFGNNVVRDLQFGWFYVPTPMLDEPVMALRRSGDQLTASALLYLVSDGAGQLLSVGDTSGVFSSALSGPDTYTPGSWVTSGLTARAQTFSPRRDPSQGSSQDATISTFRTRQYDPATGSWLQEDHAGIAGGINLYQYNGNDPNTFGDPFGLADCEPKDSLKCRDRIDPTWFDPVALLGPGLVEGIAGGIAKFVAGEAESVAKSWADEVAGAVNGVVSPLGKSEGYRVTISSGSRDVVARIKETGDFRVGIEGRGALTRSGKISSDATLTHHTASGSAEIIDMVQQAMFHVTPKP